MGGLCPALRRFGSDARKYAESERIDKFLVLGVAGTVIWSAIRFQMRKEAAAAAESAELAAFMRRFREE